MTERSDWRGEVEEVHRRRALAKAQGGPEGVARQRRRGLSTIRERIDGLLDEGSFREHGEGAGEPEHDDAGRLVGFTPPNYVVGIGRIEGRPVVVGGEDFTLRGGSPNASGLRKSVYVEDLALKLKLPLVRFHEGGGGSVTGAGRRGPVGEPVLARNRFLSMARTLETAPVAAVAVGAVAGMPAARLCAAHFSVMTRNSQVLVGGPALVERAVGERASKEELGGPEVHLPNGVVHNLAEDEADAFAQVRAFLGYLPPNVWELPPAAPGAGDPGGANGADGSDRPEAPDDPGRTEEALLDLVPRDRRKPFDMRRLIRLVLDHGSWFEMGRRFGPGQITGLARLAGHPVGVLGNDGRHYAGAMTAEGAQKVRRFAELCDRFHLPVVSFVDEPGFMIGRDAERAGTIRHGTEAILAVMRTRVPWVSVMVRKSYGVAAAAHYGPYGTVFSWPSVEQGALPLEGGVAVAFGREIAAAEDPEARRRELEAAFAAKQSPFPRAESFSVQELLDPRETRPALAEWLDLVRPSLRLLLPPLPAAGAPPWPV